MHLAVPSGSYASEHPMETRLSGEGSSWKQNHCGPESKGQFSSDAGGITALQRELPLDFEHQERLRRRSKFQRSPLHVSRFAEDIRIHQVILVTSLSQGVHIKPSLQKRKLRLRSKPGVAGLLELRLEPSSPDSWASVPSILTPC